MDTVLVVEDSRAMQRTLRRLFESDGLQVQAASDGSAGLESFRKQMPSAVVLDLKLPDIPGKELCRAFKAQATTVPVVVLSANAEVEDKVLLLELGADDYITKPFSPKELLARVRRTMRRGESQLADGTRFVKGAMPHELLTFSDVQVDFTTMEAARAGRTISLTALEFKLLKFFAHSAGKVFTREELLNEVWGYDNYPSTRTVDNHILRLRQKFEPDPSRPRHFLTLHSAGYKFVPEGHVAAPER